MGEEDAEFATVGGVTAIPTGAGGWLGDEEEAEFAAVDEVTGLPIGAGGWLADGEEAEFVAVGGVTGGVAADRTGVVCSMASTPEAAMTITKHAPIAK